MLLVFNDLLKGEKIEPDSVLVLRHTPSERDGRLRDELPWLAAAHPNVFNAYQQTQTEAVEKQMLRAKYVASFIGLERRKGSTEYAAVFVGLYKVGAHKRLTSTEFWKIPAYQQLKRYGLRGFQEEDEDKRPSVLWFDLTITDFCQKWQGKLIIDWPPPPRIWARFADKARFPISAIVEDSLLHETLPPWDELVISKTKFADLPPKWCEELSRWRGIYYIFFPSDRKGYVGSAAGEDNVYGRWKYHAKVGGNSAQMRMRKLEDFEFSVLETLDPNATKEAILEHERKSKIRLHTSLKDGGLNEN
jgi:hypothetical protein